jgi:hypothetical protein
MIDQQEHAFVFLFFSFSLKRQENLKYNSKVDPNAEKYTIHSFKWTDTEYTPRQLLDNFQQFTPFLFITTQGFLGRDEWLNTVASDEVSKKHIVNYFPYLVCTSIS